MDIDQRVLEGLLNLGSDPDRLHTVEFFFYFPNEKNAKLAASVMEREGFETDVYPPDNGDEWLCVVTKAMLPVHYEFAELRHWFNTLTNELGGKYDGWGTAVEE